MICYITQKGRKESENMQKREKEIKAACIAPPILLPMWATKVYILSTIYVLQTHFKFSLFIFMLWEEENSSIEFFSSECKLPMIFFIASFVLVGMNKSSKATLMHKPYSLPLQKFQNITMIHGFHIFYKLPNFAKLSFSTRQTFETSE